MRLRLRRFAALAVVALGLALAVPLFSASPLEDQVGRANALCLTGTADGRLYSAQINPVTCRTALSCLRCHSVSPAVLEQARFGDYSALDPAACGFSAQHQGAGHQVTVAGYLLTQDMLDAARAAVAYLQEGAPAPYRLGLVSAAHDLTFAFDDVPYIAAGPSAGLSFVVAAFSALTHTPTLHAVALTGEVTPEGNVKPVGGVAQKVEAAFKQGLNTVIMPEGDRQELNGLPPQVLRQVRLVFVKEARQALFHALGPYGPEGGRYTQLAQRYAQAVYLAAQGEVAAADALFAALQAEMPEDYSVVIWRQYLASRP